MIFVGSEILAAFLPFIVLVPIFLLLKKTLLKSDVPQNRLGFTSKRLLALLVLMFAYIIPCAILYHFLVTPVFWK